MRRREQARPPVAGAICTLLAVWVGAAAGGTPASGEHAADVLRIAEFRGGLIVHLGCGEGRLTAKMGEGGGRIVQGLDANAEHVAKAREYVASRGLSGTVSFRRLSSPGRLPYAENLVNLLVASDLCGVPTDEVLRVLAPGGVACVRRGGRWHRTVKPRPEGMDEWTHGLHGADGNPVSGDVLVGPPRRLQWTDGPAWSKKHWGPRLSAAVTAGGRIFVVQDETPTSLFNLAPRWVLIARDAFNGVVLWRRELPDWTGKDWGRVVRRGEAPKSAEGLVLGLWGELSGGGGVRDARDVVAAAGDRLYLPLTAEGPVAALDAATGKLLRRYEGISPVKQVALAEGVLLLVGRGRVRAVQSTSGRTRWEVEGTSLCAADGQVHVVRKRGQAVVCVDLRSGERRWETGLDRAIRDTGSRRPAGKAAFAGPLQAGAGIVLAWVPTDRRNREAIALSAEDGAPLWRAPFGGRAFQRGSGPLFIDRDLWVLDAARGVLKVLDAKTGRVKRSVPAPEIRHVGHHARCYESRATTRYVIGKERGADFVDLRTGKVTWNNWLRGPCHRGVLPANGLLYAGQHSCRCYTEAALHGFWAMAPASAGPPAGEPAWANAERGPAYSAARPGPEVRALQPGDWPTYRHDAMRSGATDVALPSRLTEQWSAVLSGPATPPVVAGGKVYVAARDEHAVVALDAVSGKGVWRFLAGGRIDSPPTLSGGRALFGCRDGWVYCLRAADGRLAWRFRAAPSERQVGAHGRLESAWPVPGSVLVRGGTAYCVAGRSSYLDGGLYLHALDVRTGRRLHGRHLDGPWPKPGVGATPENPNRGFTSPGALADVLVADADSIYLRHLRFDATLAEMEDMQPNVYVSPRLSGENRGGDHKYWDDLLEAPRHALFTDPAWFHRSFFQNFPGRRLYATTGLVGESWHRRMYWSYGQVVGQYLAFRGEWGYAVQAFATSPREGGLNAGDGYVVYAGKTATREEGKKLFALRPDEAEWRIRVPFRPVAMLLAGPTLYLAGPPDRQDPAEATAAVEGKRGAVLWAVSAAEGRTLWKQSLDRAPAYDGMAAAGGRLFLTTADGAVICLGGMAVRSPTGKR